MRQSWRKKIVKGRREGEVSKRRVGLRKGKKKLG